MNGVLRKTALAAALACMLNGISACAMQHDISVVVNGTEVEFDVSPKIEDGRTMVPMRAVFEALGAQVSWDDAAKTAVGEKDGSVVSITVNDRFIYKNDTALELDVPAMLSEGRTLVPVRAVSEAFGCAVDWNDDTKTVIVAENNHREPPNIPEYSGEPYVFIDGGRADFGAAENMRLSFESYSELDNLGRCGTAYANLSKDTMPTEERGKIGQVKPSGWQTVKYDFVDGKYLYNRCHLIGYQLSAENANEKNLITGTRYMNVDGMLPFENEVAQYIKETGNHVLYRVTPMFSGDNLVADGVHMEAKSVEDSGINFNVFCYNAQPGVYIDYATGLSSAPEMSAETAAPKESSAAYVLNTKSKKFHYADCSGAKNMNDANREDFNGTRDEVIGMGYSPCGICKP